MAVQTAEPRSQDNPAVRLRKAVEAAVAAAPTLSQATRDELARLLTSSRGE
jgi:hypothetical protein